jgi:hypothetical protein
VFDADTYFSMLPVLSYLVVFHHSADLTGNKKSAEDVIKSSDLSRRRARRSFRESESRRSMSELHRDRDDARSHCEGLLDCLDDGIHRVDDNEEDDPYARVRARFKEGVSVSVRQNASANGASPSAAESQSTKVSFSSNTGGSVSLDNSRKGPNSEGLGRLGRVANQNIVS